MACRLPLWPAAGFFLAYGLPFISSAGCQPELLPGQVLHVTYEAPTGKVEISSSRRFIYLNHISLFHRSTSHGHTVAAMSDIEAQVSAQTRTHCRRTSPYGVYSGINTVMSPDGLQMSSPGHNRVLRD
jgi:hypothetical protein